MSFRAASLALLALLVALVVPAALAGCGRSSLFAGETTIIGPDAGLLDSSTCGPSTCNGCCAGGTCTSGTALQTCGGGGAACADCTVPPQTGTGFCNANPTGGGACVVGPPVCDCPDGGTCDESGRCVGPCGDCAGCCVGIACLAGTAAIECGTAGNECQACAEGAQCVAVPQGGGACVSNLCGPDNCAGCCSPTGCQPGTLLSACGTLGQACESCTGSQCAPAGPNNGGVCVATGCNPQNCPGCCDANGLCQSGAGISACGTGGNLCEICSATQVCVGGELFDAPGMRAADVRGVLRREHVHRRRRGRRLRLGRRRVPGLRRYRRMRRERLPDAGRVRRGLLCGRLLRWKPLPTRHERLCLRFERGGLHRLRDRNAMCERIVPAGRRVRAVELLGVLLRRRMRRRDKRLGLRTERLGVPGVRRERRLRERDVRRDVRAGDVHRVLPGERLRIGRAEHRVRDRRGRLPELHGDGGRLRERRVRRAAVWSRDVRRVLQPDGHLRRRGERERLRSRWRGVQ